MTNAIRGLWHRLSRNGLRPDEGVTGHREIIFLNKVLAISPMIMILFLPVEVAINGFEVVPLELAFIALMVIPFLLQRYRYSYAAKLVSFAAGNIFIVVAGALVGTGVNNHIALIPLLLFGMILFPRTRDKLLMLGLSIVFYLAVHYLQRVVTPVYEIPEENRAYFTHIFYLLALLLTFLLGYYFMNINKDFEQVITEQKASIEHKNREITDSINYARRIQMSVIPGEENLKSLFRDCFVLYKPKDIVSGDFYWTAHRANGSYVAVADCTGHGVPGAFMSLVGSKELQLAFSGSGSPSQILKLLNMGVRETLQQNTGGGARDGMDIALLEINGNRVYFSSANRPLWLVRAGSALVHEVKGTKAAIGGVSEDDQEFAEHVLELGQGDCLYLFSDGYADQFGGDKQKKMSTRRFKDLLLSVSGLPMSEQKSALELFLKDWQGSLEQVDDILVIGIRLGGHEAWTDNSSEA